MNTLKRTGLAIVAMTGALLLTRGAAAQDVCSNGSSPQGVAVRLKNYNPPSDPGMMNVRLAGTPLQLGTGPQPESQEVVLGYKFERRRNMGEFRGRPPLEVPCRSPRPIDGPRPELYGGLCWAVLKYDAGDEACWHLKVKGDPNTPPFRVYIGKDARNPRTHGKVGWNVERDLPATDFVQVKIQPLPDATRNDKDKDEAALLFETGPEEISEGDVPKILDCKEILDRIVQRQLTCRSSCMSDAVYRYLAPYLGDPSDGERGQTKSDLRVTAAVRLALLKRADPVWNGQCLLPLKSLTFESAK